MSDATQLPDPSGYRILCALPEIEDIERANLMRSALTTRVPAIVLVEAAEVPIVKSRPGRTMLVLGAGVLAFALAVLAVFLFHAYRDVDLSRGFRVG